MTFNLFDFVVLEGNIAISTANESISVESIDGEGITEDMDLIKIGASDVSFFAGVGAGTERPMGLNLEDGNLGLLLMRSPTTNAQFTSLIASAGSAGFVGLPGMTVAGENIIVEINESTVDDAVANFSENPYTIETGNGNEIDLTFDAAHGKVLRTSGFFDFNMFDFFKVSGDLAFEKDVREIDAMSLDYAEDEEPYVELMDVMTIGASGLNAFVGVGNNDGSGTGFALENVSFGLALMASIDYDWRYLSVKALAERAGFVGLDNIDVSVSDLSVSINRGLDDDYCAHFVNKPLDINIGGGNVMTLDFDARQGFITQAQGHMDLDVGGFFSVSGNLSVESFVDYINISDGGEDIQSNILTIGASDIHAFVGTSDKQTGFELENLDFALAIMNPTEEDDSRTFTSLVAQARSVGFVGMDNLHMTGSDILVEMNLSTDETAFADFSTKPLDVNIGGDSALTFDFDGSLGQFMRLEGGMSFNLFDFFSATGTVAFEKSIQNITVKNPDGGDPYSDDMEVMTLGIGDLNAFLGVPSETNRIGFELEQVSLGLALMRSISWGDNYVAMKATAKRAGFVGADLLDLSLNDITVMMSTSDTDIDYAHFADEPYVINTGVGNTMSLDFDGSKGEMFAAMGSFDLNMFNFFHAKGNLSYEQYSDVIDLADESSIDATIMKIAASDVSAFAGINGPNDSPTAIGFGFENMGFGLTIANSAIEDDDLIIWFCSGSSQQYHIQYSFLVEESFHNLPLVLLINFYDLKVTTNHESYGFYILNLK
ncbi:MAG: hypothetical protein OMM_04732 [Candidatus Magnetoglobus multicellularis str. Araruama]|uniref:Uncharacterized protein n=1 Tax=Candidatus Magnetoglobus multicellularis str. Araruama TaxID=890399 RepID=A0A1V1P077_9BACT|nr:MAG: hypothetical protein OMM_04732 [Candidatus Magnetoglobus multicellularis str. Araruama]